MRLSLIAAFICLATALIAADAPPRTGHFTASFTEHAPIARLPIVLSRCVELRDAALIVRRMQAEPGGNAILDNPTIDLSTATWDVYVPEDYTPAVPHGLMVYISSGESGAPRPEWLPVLQKHHLLWAGANQSGNKKDCLKTRIPLALYARHNMLKLYNVDPGRIYVSGLSGGGRVASWIAASYADLFTGAFYFCGCNMFPEKLPKPLPSVFQFMQTRNRHVFLTGDNDMNLNDTRAVFAAYQKENIQRATLLQVPKMGHTWPTAEWFEKGIALLDTLPDTPSAAK